MDKIYVPDLTNYKCFIVKDSNTIRAYKEIPSNHDVNIDYRDYFFNSNYLYNDGVQRFSTYSTLPVCLNQDVLTTDFYYRNDFYQILIIFAIMSYFVIKIPLKIFVRLIRRLQ